MGYEYGDAQNTAVRVLLNQFSKNFKYFDSYYYQKTLEYFDYKCPYTGEDISPNNSERDHIIPLNKQCCGLHVYGNVLIVTRTANNKKGSKSLEEFLKDEPEKLAKIKKFISESGYEQIHNEYNSKLKHRCADLYKNIGIMVRNYCKEFDDEVENQIPEITSKPVTTNKISKPQKIYSNTNSNFSQLSKQDIIKICRKNGLNITNWHTKASKNSTQDKYWANPNIKNLHHDWWLTLDDYNNRIIYCFKIPANSINEKEVKVRRDKPYQIDLQIYYNNNFTDSRSGISFAKWLVKNINY